MGPIIVILIRLIVPLAIFRWPLAGGLVAAVADTFDVVLITILNMGDFENYSQLDKALDWYYLFFMAIVSWRWRPLVRWTSIGLFAYRTVGVISFEATGFRPLLFVFPNLFELFFFFSAICLRFFDDLELTSRRLSVALLILLMPKLLQEYFLHILQLQPWNWIKTNILGL